MLRRLNIELAEREVSRYTYVKWVRESIVKDVLAQRPGKELTTVPPRRRVSVEAITASWVEEIGKSGVDVVGDLDDLVPVWPSGDRRWANPDTADPEVVAEAAIQALAHVLDKIENPDAGPVARLARRLRG